MEKDSVQSDFFKSLKGRSPSPVPQNLTNWGSRHPDEVKEILRLGTCLNQTKLFLYRCMISEDQQHTLDEMRVVHRTHLFSESLARIANVLKAHGIASGLSPNGVSWKVKTGNGETKYFAAAWALLKITSGDSRIELKTIGLHVIEIAARIEAEIETGKR